MFKNYLKIAFRNLIRHKTYSFINIAGLAIGIAICILIFLFIKNELNYDTFHENADKIFRVNSVFDIRGNVHTQAVTQAPLGPAMKGDLPEVEFATRFSTRGSVVKYQDKTFKETLTFADHDVFKMFSFPLLRGRAKEILSNKNSIVITEDVARKYFGDINPLGKRFSINIDEQFEDFIVSGVVERIPDNSSIKFDFIVPFEKLKDFVRESYFSNWGLFSLRTFVQLNELSDANDVNNKLPIFIKKYVDNSRGEYVLQPLENIHFGHNIEAGMLESSNIVYSYILIGIAFLILLIASVNFINISLVNSSIRYKEIGLRKVVGATSFQLIKQFLFETLFMSTIAFAIGIILAELFLPSFNSLIDKSLNINYTGSWYSIFCVIAFILLVGILSGTYPALFLSKYQPVETIKGKQKLGRKNPVTRSLVVFQFVISIFLIVATGIIMQQLDYMKNKNLGFDSKHVLVLPVGRADGRHMFDILRNELNQYNSILNIAGANAFPGGGYNGTSVKTVDGTHHVNIALIDYNFLECFDINLKEGRNFSKAMVLDGKHSVIINETLLKNFGWESATGKKLVIDDWAGLRDVNVIGVVENFHFTSLHKEIEPLVFYVNPDIDIHYIFVKIKSKNMAETIALLKEQWQKITPDNPFKYFFMQEEFNQLYRTEEQWGQIAKYSSLLAIVITCFGLFGLSALLITKRTKEIGIRKVLGASISSIVLLLSKEFTKWVLIANLIAWAIAYYTMNKWLQNFAYRINIGWWVFLLAGTLAMVIALLTVSYQAIRAAAANPVKALRYE